MKGDERPAIVITVGFNFEIPLEGVRTMGRSKALMLAAILVATVGAFANHALARERWSAADPDNEGRVHFGWGSSKARASAAALRTCRRVSRTCATKPGSISHLDNVWALMCCTNPRFGCATGAGPTRAKAHETVNRVFVNAHYSNCVVKGYYSARTGKRF